MAQPGWYDDPQGGGGQRWWDGERWSEHTIPPPPAPSPPGMIPPPPTGAPPGGAGPVGPAGPTFVPAPGDTAPAVRPAAAPHGATAPARSPAAGGGGGSSKVLLALLGVVFVVGIVAVVIMLLTGDDEDPAVDPPPAGAITAGEERAFTVADDGEWELVVEVPAGLLVIDVRGSDGFDPVVTLLAEDGREIARNDDRSSQQQDRYGGGTFDALLEQDLPTAGSYRIVITGFAGQGGSGEVTFPVVGG